MARRGVVVAVEGEVLAGFELDPAADELVDADLGPAQVRQQADFAPQLLRRPAVLVRAPAVVVSGAVGLISPLSSDCASLNFPKGIPLTSSG